MNRRQILIAGAALLGLAPPSRAARLGLSLSGALSFVELDLPGNARATFLIDTGADVSVVDRAALARRNLESSRGLRVGFGGQYRTIRPAIRDLAHISASLNRPVDGLLGCDFFAEFQVQLDYAASTLRLEASPALKPVNAHAMRFDGIAYVRGDVRADGGALSGEFGLDTGLDTGVKLFADRARAAFPNLETRPGQTLTMSGAKPASFVAVDALRVCGLDISGLTANISDDPRPRGAGPDMIGIVGAPAFARRVLTLDFPSRWWSLSPVVL